MNPISINTINNKLKNLSDDFANEIISYLDSLNESRNEFSQHELTAIRNGELDFEKGNLYTHNQAREFIQNHSKHKLI